MSNPFIDAWRRLRRRGSAPATPPTSSEPTARSAKRLSPDGLQIVEFPPAYTTMLRLYGISGNYAQIYASQPNVRTAVDLIAREAASLSLDVFEKVPKSLNRLEASILVSDHPLHVLLDEPAPGMSQFRFWFQLFADMAIYDVAYWLKIRQRGVLKALVRVPPANLIPFREPLTGRIQYFKTADGRNVKPEELVIFWGYDPAINHGMVSPMETLRRLLAEELAAGMDREGRWRNSARKDGIIERAVDSPMMNDDSKEGFLIDVEDTLAGPNASGRPLMLQPGMSWRDVQWSPREMEYIDARKLSRTEVAAHFHVPAAMIAAGSEGQEPDHETLNFFYTSTLSPWLERVEHEIDAQLVPEFELTPQRRRVISVAFNLDEKLRGSFEERIGILATAAGGPIITVNEARRRENMPDIPGGNLIFVPLNSIRGGGPQASPRSPTETPAGTPEPAGTTPGGGTVQQASWQDVQDGRAVVLGGEDAVLALSSGVETAEDLVLRLDSAAKRRSSAEGQLAYLREQRAKYEARGRQVILKTFEREKNAIVGGRELKRDRWDRELSDDLYGFLYPAISAVGEDAAKRLGAEFDAARTSNYVRAKADGVAEKINAKTAEGEDFSEARAERLGSSLTTWLLGWAVSEALHQSDSGAVKTWHTTSEAPRPTHAVLNGKNAEDGERFGNGALYPGDATPGAGEAAGCTCLLTAGAR